MFEADFLGKFNLTVDNNFNVVRPFKCNSGERSIAFSGKGKNPLEPIKEATYFFATYRNTFDPSVKCKGVKEIAKQPSLLFPGETLVLLFNCETKEFRVE